MTCLVLKVGQVKKILVLEYAATKSLSIIGYVFCSLLLLLVHLCAKSQFDDRLFSSCAEYVFSSDSATLSLCRWRGNVDSDTDVVHVHMKEPLPVLLSYKQGHL